VGSAQRTAIVCSQHFWTPTRRTTDVAGADSAQPTDPATWNAKSLLPLLQALVSGEELADIADSREEVVLLTADLAAANNLQPFIDRHPDRFFNVGIAEKNMFTVAAAMAASGLRPFVSTFASFAGVLCAEQIRMDLAFTQLPVTVLAHHAGVSLSLYGPSHLAIEDIAMMRAIPGLTIACPSDGPSTRAVLRASLDQNGPTYVRTGLGIEGPVYDEPPAVTPGRFNRLADGDAATIIALGPCSGPARQAVEALAAQGIKARLLDALYLKPLDSDAILAAARETGAIVTVEDHSIVGGLAGAVAETVARAGVAVPLSALGFDDRYPPMGPTNIIHERSGLTADGIASAVRAIIR
jgi:transketolase